LLIASFSSFFFCCLGDALFVTPDNVEHLAMMERVFGPIPERMAANAEYAPPSSFLCCLASTRLTHLVFSCIIIVIVIIYSRRKAQKFFKGTKLRWPELARERVKHGTRYVDKMCPLADTLPGQYPDFCDLLERLLEYEPEKRMNARDALQHRFFDRARYAPTHTPHPHTHKHDTHTTISIYVF
jgi:dual-specificity kinase